MKMKPIAIIRNLLSARCLILASFGKMSLRYVIFSAALCAGIMVSAQENESRPVTGTYSLGFGGASVKATYLSPLTYSGTQSALSGSWSKAMPFNPQNAVMQFDADVSFCNILNPAKTARMVGLIADFSWDMAWRKHLPLDFQVTAGGGFDLNGGAYYLLRNSNNPVQALANFSLMLTASVSKHFKIGRLPILVSDRFKLPSLGVFFCPEYGETYYEIYLGNLKGLAHAGWWGNNFRIDNLLSVTLDFGRTALSVGYRIMAYNQWANNLNTKIVNNYFVVGVIPGGIGLKKHSEMTPEDKIYSIY